MKKAWATTICRHPQYILDEVSKVVEEVYGITGPRSKRLTFALTTFLADTKKKQFATAVKTAKKLGETDPELVDEALREINELSD